MELKSNYSFVEKFLWNFYIADLNNTTFETTKEVPNFVVEITPIFLLMVICEHFILKAMGKKEGVRVGDGLTSVGLGMFYETIKLMTRGFEVMGYQWLYQYRLIDMDWKSPWTWWAAAIGIDFAYYWAHRLAHEINFLWSGHQVHHSSEEYNLTTALRQSGFQRLLSFGIYHPLALLGVPLPAAMVHFSFNLFFQFWIHTEVVGNLGPLEWIFNTASHHRVHHGINKWCLDKNYAGFLIIWDRMFGTFEKERDDEKIVYGLVTQPQTYQIIYLQFYYFKACLAKAATMPTWTLVFKSLYFGPGWAPGTPRLGDPDQIPDKTMPRPKYAPVLPRWTEAYVVVHFFICAVVAQTLAKHYSSFSWFTALGFIGFIFLSLYCFGSFYDGNVWAPAVEAFRCIVTVAVLKNGRETDFTMTGQQEIDTIMLGYFALSSLFWCSQTVALLDANKKYDMKGNLKEGIAKGQKKIQ